MYEILYLQKEFSDRFDIFGKIEGLIFWETGYG